MLWRCTRREDLDSDCVVKVVLQRVAKIRGLLVRYRYKDLTASPRAKLIGDCNTIEATRITDLFAHQVFARNLDRCNFRLLQHNPSNSRLVARAAGQKQTGPNPSGAQRCWQQPEAKLPCRHFRKRAPSHCGRGPIARCVTANSVMPEGLD